jgi:hypothetical protein
VQLVLPVSDPPADEYERCRAPELSNEGRWWEHPPEAAQFFGVAATLFSAADHDLPEDEEPSLDVEMELLLSTMADDDPEERNDFDVVRELAVAGLMLCIDSEADGEAQSIVRALVESVTRLEGGANARTASPEDWTSMDGHSAPLTQADLLRAVSPPQWDKMLAEVTAPRQLRDASQRVLPQPTDRHVGRIDQVKLMRFC